MKYKQIHKIVYGSLVEQLGIEYDDIKPQSHLVNDLGVDSLDLVELVMTFEEKFKMDISDEEAEKLVTVEIIIDYIGGKKPIN